MAARKMSHMNISVSLKIAGAQRRQTASGPDF